MGAFQIRSIGGVGHEIQAVKINRERVDVIGIGFEVVEAGVVGSRHLGLEFRVLLRLVHRRLVLALGGFFLNFFNALLVGLDRVLLALISADEFRTGLVGFTQIKVIQRPVSVQHDAVVGTAFVIQFRLVGQQRARFLPDPDLGFLLVI